MPPRALASAKAPPKSKVSPTSELPAQRVLRVTNNPNPGLPDKARPRRTSAQVKADANRAKAEKEAKLQEKANTREASLRYVASLEDALRREDVVDSRNAVRPDLQSASKLSEKIQPPTTKPARTRKSVKNPGPATRITQGTPENDTDSTSVEFDAHADQNPSGQQDILDTVAQQRGWGCDELEDDDGVPAAEVPADSESSDGFGIGDRGDSDEGSESDRDRDADYAMPGPGDASEDEEDELYDSEPELEVRPPSKIKRVKPKRGDFRASVDAIRTQPAVAGAIAKSTKRKDPELNETDSIQGKKRIKKTEPGGLLNNWQKPIPASSHRNAARPSRPRPPTMSRRTSTPEISAEDYSVPGMFDEDEPAASTQAVRNSKMSSTIGNSKRGTGRRTSDMSVRLTEVSVVGVKPEPGTFSVPANTRRPSYTVNMLPFPSGPGGLAYTSTFRKAYKANLIHWAATIEDPFGTNAIMEQTIRYEWDANFPELDVDFVNPEQNVPPNVTNIIYSVSGSVLTDWRSSIGKDGLDVVAAYFKLGTKHSTFKSTEDIAAFVEKGLERYRFIYLDPDNVPGRKGAFQSNLVLKLFARSHLKKTIEATSHYGYPIGGLALTTASLERALGYWRGGYCSYGEGNGSDDEGDNEVQRKKAHSFTDARWGGKVRALVAVTKNLKPDEHWAEILDSASKLIGLPGDKAAGDGTDAYTTDEDFDLNSIIEL